VGTSEGNVVIRRYFSEDSCRVVGACQAAELNLEEGEQVDGKSFVGSWGALLHLLGKGRACMGNDLNQQRVRQSAAAVVGNEPAC
jgi:hypothetical protein